MLKIVEKILRMAKKKPSPGDILTISFTPAHPRSRVGSRVGSIKRSRSRGRSVDIPTVYVNYPVW